MAKDSSGKEVKSSTANKYFGVPAGFEYSESEEEEESPPPPTKPKTKKKAVVLSADKGEHFRTLFFTRNHKHILKFFASNNIN